LLRALSDGVRAGTVVRVDTGVYALPPPIGDGSGTEG